MEKTPRPWEIVHCRGDGPVDQLHQIVSIDVKPGGAGLLRAAEHNLQSRKRPRAGVPQQVWISFEQRPQFAQHGAFGVKLVNIRAQPGFQRIPGLQAASRAFGLPNQLIQGLAVDRLRQPRTAAKGAIHGTYANAGRPRDILHENRRAALREAGLGRGEDSLAISARISAKRAGSWRRRPWRLQLAGGADIRESVPVFGSTVRA